MERIKFIHYNVITSYYMPNESVKFKEFYFNKDSGSYEPTITRTYHIINLNNLENFIVDDESQFVTLLGMIGKFFIHIREK